MKVGLVVLILPEVKNLVDKPPENAHILLSNLHQLPVAPAEGFILATSSIQQK